MTKIREKDFYIGKKIIACEDTMQFSSGKKVYVRTRSIGIVEKIENGIVHIFDKSNPRGYQNYSIQYSDFIKWVTQKLYLIRSV